jgi:3(or 17)beta-hydroxysteroid dehydrogenase
MRRLEDRIAIVTGASKGLGKATAELFASEGAFVMLSDVDVENGQAAAAAIGDRARFRRHDVSSEADWEQVIGATIELFGRLDILINNAGLISVGNVETETLEQWNRVHAVIAAGTFLGCKHAIRTMKATGGGAIVNIASVASLKATPASTAYGAAKAAVEALTRSAALHCAQWHYPIRCNSVHPGPIDTPMVRDYPQQLAKAKETGFELPEGYGARFGTPVPPSEIAEAILYLASDAARGVNGTRLVVDRTMSSI